MKGKKTKKILALFLAVVMSVTMVVPAFAAVEGDIDADQERATLTYDAPTEPMEVDDTVITATAHRAASPVLGMMGLNATSGFGMINGSAPTDLASAQTCFALGVWGTAINSNPDPYYWNYFYNFYAAENDLELSDDALVNPSRASSPGGADTTLNEEYGNVSVSLSSRPEIVIGCAQGTSGGSDTSGYDNQLATINSFTPDSAYYQEGDETYSPYLISYQMTYIKQMIESVYRIAIAIDEIEAADKTKHTRYDDDPTADYYITADQTAEKYESYVYGAISYVQSQLAANNEEEKVVAVVTKINDDGTYTLADSGAASATSLVRGWEYAYGVSTSLLEVIDKTSSDAVTKEELLQADAIIGINNGNISAEALIDSFGDDEYTGTIIDETPSSLYGMTMNSVENAMGYAFVIGCLYPEYIDPVEWCAYFYETFLHVTDQASIQQCVDVNFADVSLPSGVSTTLTDYSAAAIEKDIATGYAYYEAHKEDQFTVEAKDGFYELNGLTEWGTRSASSDEEQSLIVTGDTEYVLGEELNLTVKVELADGVTKNVPVSECDITGYDATEIGAQTITVSYGDLTATYDVEVLNAVKVIANGKTITVNMTELEEAAEEQTFTRVKSGETTEITANFVNIYDILDAAGVEIGECPVVTATARDGFTKYYALGGEDATEVYLYLEDGAYRSAIDGSAANMWVSGVITITYTEHKTEIKDAKDATCTEDGYTGDEVCTVCDKTVNAGETIPATGHTIVTDAAVAATCTENGLTEGSHCSVCDEVLVAQEVIPATGHTIVTDAAVAATCTEDGLTEGSHCSVCDEVLVAQKVIPATGHTIVTDAAVAATCTKDGLTEGSHCSVCGEVLVAQEVIPATGHTLVTQNAEEATCTEDGYTGDGVCTVCGETVEGETIPATGHTIVMDEAVAATCTQTGLTAGCHCSVCGEVLVAQEVIPATGHTAVTDAAVAATCTENGLTEGSHCSVCGEVLVTQEVIPATGHTIVTDAAVAATCTEDGLTEGSHCSVCDEVLVAQEVIPAAHTWDEGVIVTEAPSYTGKGVKAYTCTVCGETKDEVYTFINGEVTSGVRTAILWAAESGISKGYTTGADAGTFGVGNTVTREEMVIFLYRLAGNTGEDTGARAAITFNDANEIKTSGGETAISWAVAEGITSGYSDGSGNFGPQDECTREQICIFLWRLAGKPAVTDEELAAVSDFADADEISNTTAEKAIAWAYSEGIVRGYTDSDDFGPTDSCLREQFAVMMYRYANN